MRKKIRSDWFTMYQKICETIRSDLDFKQGVDITMVGSFREGSNSAAAIHVDALGPTDFLANEFETTKAPATRYTGRHSWIGPVVHFNRSECILSDDMTFRRTTDGQRGTEFDDEDKAKAKGFFNKLRNQKFVHALNAWFLVYGRRELTVASRKWSVDRKLEVLKQQYEELCQEPKEEQGTDEKATQMKRKKQQMRQMPKNKQWCNLYKDLLNKTNESDVIGVYNRQKSFETKWLKFGLESTDKIVNNNLDMGRSTQPFAPNKITDPNTFSRDVLFFDAVNSFHFGTSHNREGESLSAEVRVYITQNVE